MNLKAYKESINDFFSERDNVVTLQGIKKENFAYIFIWIIYYAWVVVFSTWWTASPLTENVFGSDIRSIMHSVNLLSSAFFIIIIKKEWFAKMSRFGALFIIVGMSIFLTVNSAPIQLTSAIIIGISLGCVNTGILIPFVFTLNNTEKLYAIFLSNLLICLLSLFQNSNNGGNLQSRNDMIFSFVILIVALSATIAFKNSSIMEKDKKNCSDSPCIPSRIYLTLFFNCAFAIICKGVGIGLLNITAEKFGNSIIILYYIGGIAGCILYIIFYAFSSKAFVFLGNITFAFVSIAFLFNSFSSQAHEMSLPFALFLGAGNAIGMINMYYIIGVVGKKYNSMRYIKMSIVFIGLCGGVTGVVAGNWIHHSKASVITTVVSVCFMMSFMVSSPLMAQEQYYSDWARDSGMTDVDNEQLYLFKKYSLSKREMEVCKLLLQGYTLRQISAILSIAYSTVNTYCTCAYRKLNINSRTELLIMFKDYQQNGLVSSKKASH